MSYDKDSIKVGLTDMYKLRRVPQMYGPLSDKGFVHAIKEVVQNSLDEASADEIMKSKRIITVDVSFEPDINLVVIEDNGRGIPTDISEDAYGNKVSGIFKLKKWRNKMSNIYYLANE